MHIAHCMCKIQTRYFFSKTTDFAVSEKINAYFVNNRIVTMRKFCFQQVQNALNATKIVSKKTALSAVKKRLLGTISY
jgi:hypothetical protein